MSFLFRLLRKFRNPIRYVGRDLEGNKYYEYPGTSSDPRRTKRIVEYDNPTAFWGNIGGDKRLPVQWSSWLTHTRPNPPTLDELQADLARQRRVLTNAARIEARDREERERAFVGAPTPSPDTVQAQKPEAGVKEDNTNSTTDTITNTPQDFSESAQVNSPWRQPSSAEPEAWTPRARSRGA